MFFPEKIQSIKKTDRVLEVGPGGTPHNRSDVFLELKYVDEVQFRLQRGDTDKLITNKPVFFYDGQKFPFDDNEFDYIICSHVLEHVEDLNVFLEEIFRVAPRGYLEYPTILYEYIYNFKYHKNLLKLNDNVLFYLKKSKTSLDDFLPVQSFFYDSFALGYSSLVNDLKIYMFEGFEWESKFSIKEAKSINDLTWIRFDLPQYTPHKENIIRKLLKKI
jgi:SAM-dependent methyltransferase